MGNKFQWWIFVAAGCNFVTRCKFPFIQSLRISRDSSIISRVVDPPYHMKTSYSGKNKVNIRPAEFAMMGVSDNEDWGQHSTCSRAHIENLVRVFMAKDWHLYKKENGLVFKRFYWGIYFYCLAFISAKYVVFKRANIGNSDPGCFI